LSITAKIENLITDSKNNAKKFFTAKFLENLTICHFKVAVGNPTDGPENPLVNGTP